MASHDDPGGCRRSGPGRRSMDMDMQQDRDVAGRHQRFRELVERQRELDVDLQAIMAAQKLQRDAIGRGIWELRRGQRPVGWCSHCAEPIYLHELAGASAGPSTQASLCHRHGGDAGAGQTLPDGAGIAAARPVQPAAPRFGSPARATG